MSSSVWFTDSFCLVSPFELHRGCPVSFMEDDMWAGLRTKRKQNKVILFHQHVLTKSFSVFYFLFFSTSTNLWKSAFRYLKPAYNRSSIISSYFVIIIYLVVVTVWQSGSGYWLFWSVSKAGCLIYGGGNLLHAPFVLWWLSNSDLLIYCEDRKSNPRDKQWAVIGEVKYSFYDLVISFIKKVAIQQKKKLQKVPDAESSQQQLNAATRKTFENKLHF